MPAFGDSNGNRRNVLREALPFRKVTHYSGREQGIMFFALCNEQQRFEDIVQNLLCKRRDDWAD